VVVEISLLEGGGCGGGRSVAALAPNWVSPDSMQEWPEYVRQNTQDKFWMESQQGFHAYDYGANIEIDVAEQLRSVPKETRL
jgi:hypothetical protein